MNEKEKTQTTNESIEDTFKRIIAELTQEIAEQIESRNLKFEQIASILRTQNSMISKTRNSLEKLGYKVEIKHSNMCTIPDGEVGYYFTISKNLISH